MAAPLSARRVLFPTFAFNLEVARAPMVTQEAMIAEMRLQWWRDALDEIVKGQEVRAHEVATLLAQAISTQGAEALDRLVAARRWDIYRDPFEDEVHFDGYLRATGGALLWAQALALGVDNEHEENVLALGEASALARFFVAVPGLKALGKTPLLTPDPDWIAGKAQRALAIYAKALVELKPLRCPAFLDTVTAPLVLKRILKAPERVSDGSCDISPFRKRWALLRG